MSTEQFTLLKAEALTPITAALTAAAGTAGAAGAAPAQTAAAASAQLAADWAEKATAPAGGGTKSAKTHAGEAAASAGTAAGHAATSTTQAGISTTQAGISTTQAGIATTKAGEAAASAAAISDAMRRSIAGLESYITYGADPAFVLDFARGAYGAIDANGLLVPKVLGDLLAVTRASVGRRFAPNGLYMTDAVDVPRIQHNPLTRVRLGLLIEPARTNRLLRSSEFGVSPWAVSNIEGTITVDAAAGPDGTSTADRWTVNTANASRFMRQSVNYSTGEHVTLSNHFKQDSGSLRGRLLLATTAFGGNQTGDFNLTAGTFSVTGGCTGGMEQLPGAWWRCWISAIATATAASQSDVRLIDSAGNATWIGNGTDSMLLWGAQVAVGDGTPSTPILTTTAAATRVADVPTLIGIPTATLDVTVTYSDATTTVLAGQSVAPGYWPAGLTAGKIIRSIVGVYA